MERWLAKIHLRGTVKFRDVPLIAQGPGRCPAPGRRPAAGGRRSSWWGSRPGAGAGAGQGGRGTLGPGRRRGSCAGQGHRDPGTGAGRAAGAASHCRHAAAVVAVVVAVAAVAGCCCTGHLRLRAPAGCLRAAQCSPGWEGRLLHFLAPCYQYRHY